MSTRRWVVCFAVALVSLVVAAPSTAFEPLPRANPADRQVDEAALAAALDAAGNLGYVRAMVVARDGFILGEEHWIGPPETLRQSRSATKSVTSILVGIAIDKGFIEGGLGARMVDYLPEDLIPADPAKHEIRIFHLLTMTAGFEWDEDADVEPWLFGPDPVGAILDRPMAAPPGTVYNYNTAATHLLSVMLSEATGMDTLDFADQYLFGPLGISDRRWMLTGGYPNGGHGLYVRTEDLAKFGLLFVDRGVWAGEQIVSTYWVNVSTYPLVHNIGSIGALTELHYGLLWWLDRSTEYQIYTALGYGGQLVFCVPALRLVVAVHSRYGVPADIAAGQVAAIFDLIVDRIIPATADRRVLTTTGRNVPELAAVDDMMRELLWAHEIRDATAALTKDGRLVWARGFTLGEPDVEPVEPTSLFRIGSIGKAIASTAIHQLRELDLLAYDTRVASTLGLQPLPGNQSDPRLDEVTVDHLLTHTSGMYSEDNIYQVAEVVAAAVGAGPPPTNDEIISYIISHPFLFDPGSNWDYNNYGYIMLDMLTERLTRTHYVEYLMDEIFRPVGVGRARLAHGLQSELAPTEVDYDGIEGDPYRSIMDNGPAPGGLVMAAPDLARLFSALFDFEGSSGLLSAASLESMLELPFPVSEQLGYGRGWCTEDFYIDSGNTVGWLTDPSDSLDSHSHGGGGSGVHTLAMWRADGIGFVVFTNKDPVIETLDFPQITVWPEHDLWESVGVSLDPAGAAPTESWLPVVASGDGVGDSVWRSDVGLLNRSTLVNEIRLRLYRSDEYHDVEYQLEPGELRSIGDVMASFGVSGSSPLRVFSSEPLTVSSRTYNLAPDGTFGQFIDSATPTSGLSTGDSAVLMQLQENAAKRSNIGIHNGWKRPAEIEIALYDGDGTLITTAEQVIPPEQTVQLNRPFRELGGRVDIESGYAVLSVGFGQHLLVYASVVDNATNDPTTIPMKVEGGSNRQWVAAAAHTTGAHGSEWRTDLCLLNLSGEAASIEVVFHRDGGAPTTMPITLAKGQQRLIADAVLEMGADGGGSIELLSDRPVLVSSRTYNAGSTGTFGQYLDGTAAAKTAARGQLVWLPQLQQSSSFRTNIGFLNSGATQATLRIRLFDRSGRRLAAPTRRVAPGARLQLQEPFANIAGRDDIDAGYATVTVEEGDGVIAYASVIDNATNDPTTVPMAF